MEFRNLMEKLFDREDLEINEMESVMNDMMTGNLSEIRISALLSALRVKGESVSEITACAKVMREKAISINPDVPFFIDTCGTGGDSSGTFNISTCTAFVVSGAGVPVAKHGNRSVSSRSGSADVLEKCGVKIDIPPDKVRECIEKIGIGFLFAPGFHKAMKYAMPVRRDLGLRTIFNVLGPLANPANAPAQIMGVFDQSLVNPLAQVLKNIGLERAFVFNGGGLDEIALHTETKTAVLKDGIIREMLITPEELGFKRVPLESISGDSPEQNAEIMKDILSGVKGAYRDIVLMNAAAGLVAGKAVETLKEGVVLAAESIDSGNAMKKLVELVGLTND
ncbi:MAG: anthranilate phosphoribosyltransferase [Candidatus Muiribacteriaceae bacterium]